MQFFFIFFKLGFYAFGGGYSMIPLIESEVVDKKKLLTKESFDDIIAIANGLPGAVGLNTAIFIGYLSFGWKGALWGAAGSILPSMIIVSSIMVLFSNFSDIAVVQAAFLGIRPVVVAMILYAALRLAKGAYRKKGYIVITAVGFVVSLLFPKIPIPFLIIAGFGAGVLLHIKEVLPLDTD